MPGALFGVTASAAEIAAALPGDDVVPDPDVVMDRAFTLDADPETVWPWLLQLGKARAGWYLPRRVERFVPRSRRAIRHVDARWLQLRPGEVIPDYGGQDASFEAVRVEAPVVLVYRSRRGRTELSWAIHLCQVRPPGRPPVTRVQLRLRLAPVRHRWLARTAGEALDVLTVAAMAAGLKERLATEPPAAEPDAKDWTWVLDRRCAECGFEPRGIDRDELPALIRSAADEIRAALTKPTASDRPAPRVWSPLEYACHVRDACVVFGERVRLMLDMDNPVFPNWDQDETALTERYWEQQPTAVGNELTAAAERVAMRLAAVSGDEWRRGGRRSNGSVFTVESLGRYLLHDLVHHVHDIRP
ncbi:MAG TPA: DinB family protein [Jatrophihabitantaceae bacterium]|nr:DinB family protein [Jatrophihabitantaceae bacterium]